jgi:hypothetical protein
MKSIAVALGVVMLGACGGDDDDSSSGGSADDWCAVLGLGAEGDAIFSSLATADPATLEAGMDRIEELVPQLESAAPAAISDDVAYLAQYTKELNDNLAAAGYVIFDADLSFADPAELDEVQSNLDTYSKEECGQPFGDDDSADGDEEAEDSGNDADFDPGAGTIREQLVQQFITIGFTQQEAECIADGVDPTDESILSGDEAAIIELFEVCEIPLSRLAELGG